MKWSLKLYLSFAVIMTIYSFSCNSSDSVPDMDSNELEVREIKQENGEYEKVSYWKDSIRHGKYEAYYPDGKMDREGYYYLNEMAGEWKFYRKDGSIAELSDYIKNQKDGRDTMYFQDGKVERAGTYTMDKQNGPWYYFWPNGQLKNKITLNMEKPLEGSYMSFDSLGNLLTDTTNFKNL